MNALHKAGRWVAISGLVFAVAGAIAQTQYPAHAIRLVVPFPPGAGTDAIARLVAQKLGDGLGQPVVVENRTGAGGAIGAVEVAKAAPDGYTLLLVASPFTTVPLVARDAGYDPVGQFTPVAAIASGPLAFVVNLALPVTSLREFIDLARREPGKLNYGSAGNGSVNHLALALFNARTGVELVHVPYRGIADAAKDLMAGQIQAMTASISATLPQMAAGKLKVLAVTGKTRIALLPDVPAWGEQGVANAEVINYWGLVAPKGTPKDVVERLNREVRRALADPAVRDRLAREGAQTLGGPPEVLGQLIADDFSKWKRLIVEAKLRFE
jgi:tripartite-type tricarboxylate transporter receptor subunit TctC